MDDKGQVPEQIPPIIGRYQILGSIGYGAMGAVYKAFDPLIKRTLAIKTIRLDIPRQSPQYKSFIERFYHEARISGTLSHPNIVTLFDIGEEGGIPYLAMEYVEGETIASMIDKGVRFNPEKVINLVSQIASAVDYAHSRGVIHRDIKPSNLILFEKERVKVTDFGIAKLVDAEMTQSGTLLGTPSYMSPEQAMGDKLDGRSDIFSLGVCAFEMLSGEQPFPGNNVTSILYKLVHVDPIEPANLEMHGLVPQKWHEVFSKVLAKKPDDRYQTATEFVQDLEYCLGAWFGAAVGEETLAEGAGETVVMAAATARADAAKTVPPPPPAPPPAPAPVTDETTKALPVLAATPAVAPPAPRPAPVAPPPRPVAEPVPSPPIAKAAPPPPPPASDELPPTVHMKAPAEIPPPEPQGETVVMKADELPPPPPREKKKDKEKKGKPAPPPVAAADAVPTVRQAVPKEVLAEPAATVRAQRPPEAARPAPPPPPAAAKPAPPPPPQPEAVKPVPPPPPPAAKAPPLPPTARAPIPETVRAPRPGVSPVLILGGAALVFVFAVALAAFVVLRNRSRAAAPPPPTIAATMTAAPPSLPPPPTPAAAPGGLHVETQPAGATVTVNGEEKGVTPLDLAELPLATYDVKVDLKGYESRKESVTLTEAAPKAEVKFPPLARPGPATGLTDVLSTPFGATVTVDGGRNLGQTPLTGVRLTAGSHEFQFAKDGYEPFRTTVKIDAGKRARVDAQLKAIAKATPTPAVEAVDRSRIYLNTSADVDILARKISGASASYPDNGPRLKSGDSVSSSVSFVVTEEGEVTDLKVVESGGKAVDDAVMQAIRGWKYSPAVRKGVTVKVRITFKQTFRAG